MKLFSPYTSWRERLVTLVEISLLAAIPIVVHVIFWSDAGIDATGRSLTAEQWQAVHETGPVVQPLEQAGVVPEPPLCEGCFRVE